MKRREEIIMGRYKNWKCYSYRFTNKKRDYSYEELKPYFYNDGSEVIYCKKDFGECKAGNYYLVFDGKWYGGWKEKESGFIVNDWTPFKDWLDKEYMKE